MLQQITRTFYELVPAFERTMGMSRARWQILALLAQQEYASQAALAQRLRVDSAAVTRQVKQLESEGLLVRRVDPQDNRFTLVTLTPAGSELVERLRSQRDAFEMQALAGLSQEELAVLERGLGRIRANVRSLAQGLPAPDSE